MTQVHHLHVKDTLIEVEKLVSEGNPVIEIILTKPEDDLPYQLWEDAIEVTFPDYSWRYDDKKHIITGTRKPKHLAVNRREAVIQNADKVTVNWHPGMGNVRIALDYPEDTEAGRQQVVDWLKDKYPRFEWFFPSYTTQIITGKPC